jgi:hypothetical protein
MLRIHRRDKPITVASLKFFEYRRVRWVNRYVLESVGYVFPVRLE